MRRFDRTAALLIALSLLAAACGPGDPRAAALQERTRWKVELLSWVPKDDGMISLSVRVHGPPNSKLATLTFRVSQLDASEQVLSESWQSVDLSQVPRGAPKDMLFSVRSAGDAVEGLAATLVLQPTPEEAANIPELQNL